MKNTQCHAHGGKGLRSDDCARCNELRQTWENNEAYCGVTASTAAARTIDGDSQIQEVQSQNS